jgi:hypothetical protein
MRKVIAVLAVVIGLWALISVANRTNTVTKGRTAGKPAASSRVSETLASWPESSRPVAETIIAKYGDPSDKEDDKLVWKDAKPWKRVTVYRTGDKPLEQVVSHPVPEEKARELEQIKGEVWSGIGKDEITARSDKEEINFLAVNLAHEVLVGEKTIAQAKKAYAREKSLVGAGKTSKYREGLLFDDNGKTSELKRRRRAKARPPTGTRRLPARRFPRPARSRRPRGPFGGRYSRMITTSAPSASSATEVSRPTCRRLRAVTR